MYTSISTAPSRSTFAGFSIFSFQICKNELSRFASTKFSSLQMCAGLETGWEEHPFGNVVFANLGSRCLQLWAHSEFVHLIIEHPHPTSRSCLSIVMFDQDSTSTTCWYVYAVVVIIRIRVPVCENDPYARSCWYVSGTPGLCLPPWHAESKGSP